MKNTFDIEGASNLYLEFQKMAEDILYEVCEKAIKLHCKNYKIKEVSATKYSVEMNNRLQKLYRKSYTKGYKAVENEIKVLKGTITKLSGEYIDEDEMQAVSTAIKRYSDRLLFNIDTVIPDVLDSSWDPTKETAEEFIQRQGFLDGFKTDKRTLIEKTTDGVS